MKLRCGVGRLNTLSSRASSAAGRGAKVSRVLPRSSTGVIYGPSTLARNSWVQLARSQGLSENQINDLATFFLNYDDGDDDGELSLKAGLVVRKPLVVLHRSDNASTCSYKYPSYTSFVYI